MQILLVDDDYAIRDLLRLWLKGTEHSMEHVSNGMDVLQMGRSRLENYELAFIDWAMPGINGFETGIQLKESVEGLFTVMMTSNEASDIIIQAFRDWRFDDFLTKPVRKHEFFETLIRAQKYLHQRKALTNEVQLNKALRLRWVEQSYQFIGTSAAMDQVRQMISKVAPLDAPVLIQGETGTGKELVARELYKQSRRSHGPFVPVNCGAIPTELFESELFGHEKGAFTGAIEKKEGIFKLANGGTLFLDEIGDLPMPLQVKLLRVLQDSVIFPVGSNRPIHVNVRIISATHQNLHEHIAENRFRQDLFYRLNVFSIPIPPLRERVDDIEPLVRHFVSKYSHTNPQVTAISDATFEMLRQYSWRGNVRELENQVARALAFCRESSLKSNDFPDIHKEALSTPRRPASTAGVPSPIPPYQKTLAKNPEQPESSVSTAWTRPLPSSVAPDVEGERKVEADYETVWRCFEQNQFQLWQIRNKNKMLQQLEQILANAHYQKRGHFGRIVVREPAWMPVIFRYISPIHQRVMHLEITFRFLCEGESMETLQQELLDFNLPTTKKKRANRILQPVYKGMPDSYIFDQLYPPAKRNAPMQRSPQMIARAMVLRFAQTRRDLKTLKKIFQFTMNELITESLRQDFDFLPSDGMESIRACLCSSTHVFGGISSKMKANPLAIEEEIRQVFPQYRILPDFVL